MLRQLKSLEKSRDHEYSRVGGPTLGELYGMFLGLPALRGLWLAGNLDQTGAMYDSSGQGRALTYGGGNMYILNNLLPFFHYPGGGFHNRADEAGLRVTGTETYVNTPWPGLTFGGWFRTSEAAPAASRGFLGKWNATGNQRSYLLFYNITVGQAASIVSVDGSASTQATAAAGLSLNVWHFLVGRFTPSTELAVFADNVKAVNTTSIPASIFNSTADFRVAQFNAGGATTQLTGDFALGFLCAAALPDTLLTYLFNRSRLFFGV